MASYSLISAQALQATASSVTFSSIPSTYTDLVIVCQPISTISSGTDNLKFQFNGDTGTNYSRNWAVGNNASSYGSGKNVSFASIVDGDVFNTAGCTFSMQIFNYANSSNYRFAIFKNGNNASSSSAVDFGVARWANNSAAINSINISSYAGNSLAAGSTFYLYGIVANGAPKATGGTISTDGVYWYHTFGSTSAFVPNTSITADILVVAGGGGGGECTSGYTNRAAGGGGAGGLLGYTSQSLTATAYTVTIGAGGSGGLTSGPVAPTAGSNSQFASLTASVGGGYGGVPGVANAGSGGSGGGGADNNTNGTATSGQGNNGAGGNNGTGGVYAAGGGGGAGGIGGTGTGTVGGAGGVGSSSYTSWGTATKTGQLISSTYYYAIGGTGGGGTGGTGPAGAFATGNGGGGAYSVNNGSAGGSGIVIVRYPVG